MRSLRRICVGVHIYGCLVESPTFFRVVAFFVSMWGWDFYYIWAIVVVNFAKMDYFSSALSLELRVLDLAKIVRTWCAGLGHLGHF